MHLPPALTIILIFSPVLCRNNTHLIPRYALQSREEWPFLVDIHFIYRTDYRDYFHYPYHLFMCSGVIWNNRTVLTSYECMIKYHYNWSETTGSTTKWKLRSVYVFFGQPDVPKLGTNTGSKYEHEQMYHVNMDLYHRVDINSKLSLLTLSTAIPFNAWPGLIGCACGPVWLREVDRNNCMVLGWERVVHYNLPRQICQTKAKALDCMAKQNCLPGEFEVEYLEPSDCNTTAAALVCPLANQLPSPRPWWSLVGIASRTDKDKPFRYFEIKQEEAAIEFKAGEEISVEPTELPSSTSSIVPGPAPSSSSSCLALSWLLGISLFTIFGFI